MDLGLWVQGLRFGFRSRVQGLGSGVQGLGFWVLGFKLRVLAWKIVFEAVRGRPRPLLVALCRTRSSRFRAGVGFRVWGLGFGVWSLGFGVKGLRFRV